MTDGLKAMRGKKHSHKTIRTFIFYPAYCHDCNLSFVSRVAVPKECKWCKGNNVVGVLKPEVI